MKWHLTHDLAGLHSGSNRAFICPCNNALPVKYGSYQSIVRYSQHSHPATLSYQGE